MKLNVKARKTQDWWVVYCDELDISGSANNNNKQQALENFKISLKSTLENIAYHVYQRTEECTTEMDMLPLLVGTIDNRI